VHSDENRPGNLRAIPFAGFNERPVVELTAAPAPFDSVFYQVHLAWKGTDPVGEIDYYVYAVDPPVQGDTAWVRTEATEVTLFFESSTPPEALPGGGPVLSTDFHVFVIKAVDNGGLPSAPVHRAFTSYTVAPQTQITSPLPSRFGAAWVPTTFQVKWEGIDEDGVSSKLPTHYKHRALTLFHIQSALGLGSEVPTELDLQEYFSEDAPVFAGWDSVPASSPFAQFEALTPDLRYYFAVVAFDEAGSYEPRFLLGSNVLQFRASSYSMCAPKITAYNEFFNSTQFFVGIDDPPLARTVRLEFPEARPLTINWKADPCLDGTLVTSYRWVFDPTDGDIYDETPRENENQTYRWSVWSLYETRATVGPFQAQQPGDDPHYLYIQARDNIGSISLMVIEIRVIGLTLAKPLLVFDDFRAPPDRIEGGSSHQPYGAFPTEAVLDSLMHARGGMPWQYQPLGRTTSDPGMFAGFDHDSLDYRFFPFNGLPLSVISEYQAVVWFTSAEDAGRRGGKFTSIDPMAALRFANTFRQLNTLAVYSEMGGMVWLFGDGVCPAIANGYVSRFPGLPFARYPFKRDEDGPSPTSILWPGNFLHDFLHARSRIDLNSFGFFILDGELVDMIPYLPKHRTPGAEWPPVPGEIPPRGPTDDPRVGPSADRNLDPVQSAGGWGIPAISQDLPMLTITTEWPDWPRAIPNLLDDISYVSLPNLILEDHDGNSATPMVSRLDTLYLMRAVREIISTSPERADGKPVFFYYWGDDNGPIAWTSVNIWMFERTQLRTLAEIVLSKFGLFRNPSPKAWTGPGSVHDRIPRVVEPVP
jgi:hypothetical protein